MNEEVAYEIFRKIPKIFSQNFDFVLYEYDK